MVKGDLGANALRSFFFCVSVRGRGSRRVPDLTGLLLPVAQHASAICLRLRVAPIPERVVPRRVLPNRSARVLLCITSLSAMLLLGGSDDAGVETIVRLDFTRLEIRSFVVEPVSILLFADNRNLRTLK